ncbi:hypothetical protein RIF29_42151 [Crotalaria pallida]|uniref:Uncharacterized protein n=1 Tax=Crotalaria pallida TaxID=3830 RepID=A0AAN9E7M1_CROPI
MSLLRRGVTEWYLAATKSAVASRIYGVAVAVAEAGRIVVMGVAAMLLPVVLRFCVTSGAAIFGCRDNVISVRTAIAFCDQTQLFHSDMGSSPAIKTNSSPLFISTHSPSPSPSPSPATPKLRPLHRRQQKDMPAQKVETGHQDTVHDVAMDYYGKRLATASSDHTIKIIGVSNTASQHLATLTGHQGPVWQVAWAHPKFGSLLASCSFDAHVIIWKEGNQNEWTQAHVFSEHSSSVNSLAWAPHELGLSLACGSSDGNISVFTARADDGWDTSKIDQAHPVGVTSVSWAPSTAPGALVGASLLDPVQKLCSGGCDSTVKVWKLTNGIWKMDCFPALNMHTDWVRDVAWAPNLGLPKSTIASASQDGKVIIWTVAKDGDQWEGKVLNDFKTPVWRVSWSLTGNILAVADGNNNVTLWKEAVDGDWQQVTTVEP